MTGAGSGIGLRFTQEAVAEGADCIAMVRDASEMASLSDFLPADRIVGLDLSVQDAIAPSIARAVEHLGGLDGLVHAAGVFDHRGALETDLAQWQRSSTSI